MELGVGLGFAVDHPLGQRFADAAAMQEIRYDRAGAPITVNAFNRTDKRIAIGREGERAVHPSFRAGCLQGAVALKTKDQLILDTVGLLLEKLHSATPRRAVHGPMFVVNLIDPSRRPFWSCRM